MNICICIMHVPSEVIIEPSKSIYTCIHLYTYIRIHVYVCMYIYICIYMCRYFLDFVSELESQEIKRRENLCRRTKTQLKAIFEQLVHDGSIGYVYIYMYMYIYIYIHSDTCLLFY